MSTEGYAEDGTMLKDLAQFDLAQEIKSSEEKKPWPMGHFAKTLFKKSDFRMVLVSMEKGSAMKEHHADGALSIQVCKGSIRLTVNGEAHELHLNNLFTLAASIKHEVAALEDSAILITIAWPDEEKLRNLQHRGYGT